MQYNIVLAYVRTTGLIYDKWHKQLKKYIAL